MGASRPCTQGAPSQTCLASHAHYLRFALIKHHLGCDRGLAVLLGRGKRGGACALASGRQRDAAVASTPHAHERLSSALGRCCCGLRSSFIQIDLPIRHRCAELVPHHTQLGR